MTRTDRCPRSGGRGRRPAAKAQAEPRALERRENEGLRSGGSTARGGRKRKICGRAARSIFMVENMPFSRKRSGSLHERLSTTSRSIAPIRTSLAITASGCTMDVDLRKVRPVQVDAAHSTKPSCATAFPRPSSHPARVQISIGVETLSPVVLTTSKYQARAAAREL